MEPSVTIVFTQTDLNALSVLLDAAVRGSGLQVAKSAVQLADKIQAAISATSEPEASE